MRRWYNYTSFATDPMQIVVHPLFCMGCNTLGIVSQLQPKLFSHSSHLQPLLWAMSVVIFIIASGQSSVKKFPDSDHGVVNNSFPISLSRIMPSIMGSLFPLSLKNRSIKSVFVCSHVNLPQWQQLFLRSVHSFRRWLN